MDILFCLLIILMLVFICGGTIAYCVVVKREAHRAHRKVISLCDELSCIRDRLEIVEVDLVDLTEKTAHSASQSATTDADRANEQYDRMQAFQLKNYGLHFEGVSTDEN